MLSANWWPWISPNYIIDFLCGYLVLEQVEKNQCLLNQTGFYNYPAVDIFLGQFGGFACLQFTTINTHLIP